MKNDTYFIFFIHLKVTTKRTLNDSEQYREKQSPNITYINDAQWSQLDLNMILLLTLIELTLEISSIISKPILLFLIVYRMVRNPKKLCKILILFIQYHFNKDLNIKSFQWMYKNAKRNIGKLSAFLWIMQKSIVVPLFGYSVKWLWIFTLMHKKLEQIT